MSKAVCRSITTPDDKHHGWVIFCPGCRMAHVFDKRWEFNGDQVKPTFTGSYLQHRSPSWPADGSHPRCHSFVKDGTIQFLSDCDHELAGKTLDLKPRED